MSPTKAKRPLTCIFDLDSIIVDLFVPWLGWYNNEFNDNLKVSDLRTWHIHNHVKPECGRKIYDFFSDPERYAASPLVPGAKEGLARIHEAGHRIIIATATGANVNKALVKSDNEMASTRLAKLKLIDQAAPFIDNVYIGPDKFIICGDVFVDDSPENVRAYKKQWPEAKTVTIAYPYNEDIMTTVDYYAVGYRQQTRAWSQIVSFITETCANANA